MPIYDYVCRACDHELEALQNFNEAPLTTCPACHEETLKKRVTAPAFTFKGGGWYKDLYGSSGSKPKPTSNTSATPSTSSKSKD